MSVYDRTCSSLQVETDSAELAGGWCVFLWVTVNRIFEKICRSCVFVWFNVTKFSNSLKILKIFVCAILYHSKIRNNPQLFAILSQHRYFYFRWFAYPRWINEFYLFLLKMLIILISRVVTKYNFRPNLADEPIFRYFLPKTGGVNCQSSG